MSDKKLYDKIKMTGFMSLSYDELEYVRYRITENKFLKDVLEYVTK